MRRLAMRHLKLATLSAALSVGACALPGGQVPQSPSPPPADPSSASVKAAASGPVAAKPVVMPTRQVVVVLAASERARWDRIQSDLGAEHSLRYLRSFPLRSIDVQCLVYEVPEGRSFDEAVQRLRGDPRVDDAQPNRTFGGLADDDPGTGPGAASRAVIRSGIDPDPYARLQWGRKAMGLDGLAQRASGRGVTVAVVDTGADTGHPDLGARVLKREDLVQAEGDSFDADQHGTAVAGIISAVAGNQTGIAGVAPDAQLIVLKACRQSGSDKALCLSWTIARAIDAAIIDRARVINLSLSGPPDALIARLIRRADQSGIFVIAAAEAERPSFPASMPEVIGVLASDARGRVAAPLWSKSRGLVAAPGVEVITTVPGARYDFLSGSSLSSAHVSGLVALLLELAPGTTPESMRIALLDGAPSRRRSVASGIAGPAPRPLDAVQALRALQTANDR